MDQLKKIGGWIAVFIFGAGIMAVLLAAVFWWPVYKYKDCRKVGHSKTYCIMKIFAN